MKTALLLSVFALFPGGERERGLLLYRDGKFAEAAAAFRAAIEQDGDSAELQWNLALASWRAGDLPTAETAAEKYAALDKNARVDLHAGMLGAVRHDEAMALDAKAAALQQAPPPVQPPGQPPAAGGTEPPAPEDPLPVLEQALAKATQARDYFVRGASASPTAELLRNTERSLRTIDELQKKIDELKKQREPQKDDQKQDDKKEGDEKDDKEKQDKDKKDEKGEQSKDDKQQQPEEKPEEQKPGEPKPEKGEGEEKPEPKPGQNEEQPKPDDPKPGEPKPEPKPEQQPEPKPGEKRQDAPGEQAEGKELTPEQLQRLLEQLRDLDDKQKQIRARAKSGRRPVERDW
jgi:tetratricopeptide (TPR) repeat protein